MPKYDVWSTYRNTITADSEFEAEQIALEDIESNCLRSELVDEEEESE